MVDIGFDAVVVIFILDVTVVGIVPNVKIVKIVTDTFTHKHTSSNFLR